LTIGNSLVGSATNKRYHHKAKIMPSFQYLKGGPVRFRLWSLGLQPKVCIYEQYLFKILMWDTHGKKLACLFLFYVSFLDLIYSFIFWVSGTRFWNSLPKSVKDSPKFSFKGKIRNTLFSMLQHEDSYFETNKATQVFTNYCLTCWILFDYA